MSLHRLLVFLGGFLSFTSHGDLPEIVLAAVYFWMQVFEEASAM